MKKLVLAFAFIFTASMVQAQDYLDILKVSHNTGTFGNLETDEETEVANTNVELYYPIPLTQKIVSIVGFTYENTRLGFQPLLEAPVGPDFRTNLVMTRLNAGVKLNHGNKWSGTYVLLPKFATDFDDMGGDDFQMGGLALLEKKYKSRKILKFGAYASTENFGTTLTPLIGLWYKTRNRKLYVNATLPIRADVNYSLMDHLSVGANLLTSVKSYNLSQLSAFNNGLYVQEESIRFSLFAAYGFFKDMLIVRGRVGYDTTDFGLYEQGDEIGLQVLTFQVGGDDRNRLNNEFDAAPFVGIDLIFRTGL